MAASPHIEVTDLVIRYGNVAAVGPISFTAEAGKQLTLLGPSGCGKTTTLRAVAGLEAPESGRIRIGDRTMFDSKAGTNVPTEQRGLSMVFQSYAIWPHMSVFDNVAYGLRVRGKSAAEVKERVGHALDLVQMSAYGARSAWRWRAPAPSRRRCCCSTSRCRTSTPNCAATCESSCANCSTASASRRA